MLDIILPVYYEKENIKDVLKGIERFVKTSHRVSLVHQDSNDPTLVEIKKINDKTSCFKLVKSKYGVGVVEALKTGFEQARGEIICIMMADLSDDPKDIDEMVGLIEKGYDFVCASRYSKDGKREEGPIIKGILSFLACKTLRLFTGIPTNDATNAFKCFRRRLLKEIKIESKAGFELPLELTVKAHSLGYKIAEIPTTWKERKKGKSKFKLFKLLPYYLRWYIFGIRSSWF